MNLTKITGKYNEAYVYTNIIEEEALQQIYNLCRQEFTAGSKIRIMPDVHAGAGCTIGTTMTITDKIVPNLVGVDIGCGMETIQVKNKHIELEQLDKLIYQKIPSGFRIREKEHGYNDEIDLTKLRCLKSGKINISRARKSLGTLGGGNHFIEANKDEDGRIYLVVHSGSRHLGLEVAGFYQNQAYLTLKSTATEIRNLTKEYKKAGREHEIQSAIQEINQGMKTKIPKNLAYVEGQLFDDYLHDMKIVQRYAMLSRKAMMDEMVRGLKLKVEEEFTTIHNYIDTQHMILRKGAVSAMKNEKLLIPINMRDGSLICMGKGNEDWNFSAPHGAGRLMSRTKAKNTFTVSQFKKQMNGIYTTSVNSGTIDECPMAYKSMEEIMENIKDSVDVVKVIKPIYNFKAGEEG